MKTEKIEFGQPVTVKDLGNGRVWPDDAGEISGFGGAYEDHCRKMLRGALEWFDANPDANPLFRGYEGVFGIISEDNKDAQALHDAISIAGDHDFTGAMYHAVVSCALYVQKNSWEKLIENKREQKSRDKE